MPTPKLLAYWLAGISSIATPMSVGFYQKTKVTIGYKLASDIMPGESDDPSIAEGWKKLSTQLSFISEPNDLKLKELKKNSDESGTKLKEWCLEAYEKTYSSWFHAENNPLLTDTQNACVLPIKSQIENDKQLLKDNQQSDKNKGEFTKKITSLRKHKDSSGILDEKLSSLKEKQNNNDDWKQLEDWCQEAYKKGFQGKSSNAWKLVELYCIKSQDK